MTFVISVVPACHVESISIAWSGGFLLVFIDTTDDPLDLAETNESERSMFDLLLGSLSVLDSEELGALRSDLSEAPFDDDLMIARPKAVGIGIHDRHELEGRQIVWQFE